MDSLNDLPKHKQPVSNGTRIWSQRDSMLLTGASQVALVVKKLCLSMQKTFEI